MHIRGQVMVDILALVPSITTLTYFQLSLKGSCILVIYLKCGYIGAQIVYRGALSRTTRAAEHHG